LGRLLQADLAPASFSLSNICGSGADRFEAIIYPGQSGILAVGRRHEE
jgi:pyruvate/2-oxoglutarate dehydrogenase complex dihydrolipoamide acyltransferase (E2) component